MRRLIPLFAAVALTAAAAPVNAQTGFALKGHFLFNESTAKGADRDQETPSEDGFSIGAEVVLPMKIGIGVSAYANGRAREADVETQSFGMLAEANYFLDLPAIPITPYAGVHAGLGRYTYDDLGDATPEIEDSRTQLGFQVGLRLQLTRMFGIDAQYRRMSDSASNDQSPDLERNHVLVGVTLF
ncbi:MAG TPA: outer membrane beta-barrel protein [Longimicrobium sp.]|jgi:hypothetical protein